MTNDLINETFKSFDKNRHGKLSKKEFEAYTLSLNENSALKTTKKKDLSHECGGNGYPYPNSVRWF